MANGLVFEAAPTNWTVRVMTAIAVLVLIAVPLGIALFKNLKAALRFPEVRGAMPAQGAMKGLIRVFGNGGLFSYYGKFRSTDLGAFRMYATPQRNLVLVHTKQGFVAISPDKPQALMDSL